MDKPGQLVRRSATVLLVRQGERTTLTLVAAAVTALLLGGCSGPGEDPQPTPTPSGGQSVVETMTPTPTPTATPPEMPAAAKKADSDGAAAFIRYYFDLANYSYTTGDTAVFERLRAGDCKACASLEDTVTGAFSDGGRIKGGVIDVGDVVVTPGDPKTGLEAKAVLNQAPGEILNAEGVSRDTISPAEDLLVSLLVEYRDGWTLIEWGSAVVPTR